MQISKKRKFIFIHTHKTAGSSIGNALKPFTLKHVPKNKLLGIAYRILNKIERLTSFDPGLFDPHISASALIDAIGEKTFNSYFSFAFVRNPWDWQVSLYCFILKSETHRRHDLVKSFGDFDTYIKWRCAEGVWFQKDFIYSKEGVLLVDFVGRFENLDEDFKKICHRIGISTTLPKLNVSNTTPYQLFYNDETRELVRKTFEPDISLFGYEFE